MREYLPDHVQPSTADVPENAADGTRRATMQTRNLSLSFADKPVLHDISLEFASGSITALLGPTGSGKTTLLRTLNRMNDRISGFAHEGDAFLDGHSLWAPHYDVMALRRRVGMLFQRPNPFPMSIIDNVASGVRAHRLGNRRQARSIAAARLKEVGLWNAVSGRLNDSPFRLSGGQQQLLCLARTLAVGPDILLLDEPTSSLDPISTAAVEQLVTSLSPALTIVVVTHNLAQARRIAHRAAFLYEGRLVEVGEAAQVLDAPREEQTAKYVSGQFG